MIINDSENYEETNFYRKLEMKYNIDYIQSLYNNLSISLTEKQIFLLFTQCFAQILDGEIECDIIRIKGQDLICPKISNIDEYKNTKQKLIQAYQENNFHYYDFFKNNLLQIFNKQNSQPLIEYISSEVKKYGNNVINLQKDVLELWQHEYNKLILPINDLRIINAIDYLKQLNNEEFDSYWHYCFKDDKDNIIFYSYDSFVEVEVDIFGEILYGDCEKQNGKTTDFYVKDYDLFGQEMEQIKKGLSNQIQFFLEK